MSDTLKVFSTVYPDVTGIKVHDANGNVLVYTRGGGGSSEPTLQSKTATPTESSQTITPDTGYDGLSSVQINAISSTYVGSGIDQNDSDDLTASGATVTAPAGYYAASASKSVASGTAGTPTATKGTVSNHQVSITPSVTNTTGYITGGTNTGTAVTVTASELASGNKEITQNGTNIDVVGYSTVSVDVPSTAIITDTTDAAGGTVRTITTTNEVHLQTKTITPTSSQQTVLPDTGYDGFSSVIVGASSGGTPSATAHTIYFEFTDNTNTTITAYYDNSFISNAITATTPTTYGSKTVTLAQLDGVTWYEYDPSEQWETLYEGTTQLVQDTPYPYWWISSLSSTNISVGSVWRITMDGVESGRLTATNSEYGGMIGNPLYSGGSDDGSGLKYDFFNAGWGAWSGGADMTVGNHTVKIERLVS